MSKRSIVLVDDDPATKVVVEELVQRAGFDIVSIDSTQKALAYFDRPTETIAMVIADMTMPPSDGIAFLKEVKKRPAVRTVPFLFLSALNDTQVLISAFQQGAVDYFIKPIKGELFIAKIRSMVDAFEQSVRGARTLLSGQLRDTPVEEILVWCDRESLNGFVRIERDSGEVGWIGFVKGLPELIEIRDSEQHMQHTDTEAFERIREWTDGRFEVRRGDEKD
jgi:DNA-binding response OmpR family regulator